MSKFAKQTEALSYTESEVYMWWIHGEKECVLMTWTTHPMPSQSILAD